MKNDLDFVSDQEGVRIPDIIYLLPEKDTVTIRCTTPGISERCTTLYGVKAAIQSTFNLHLQSLQ